MTEGSVLRKYMPDKLPALIDLYDLSRQELEGMVVSWGLSPVHAATLWNQLYYECAASIGEMVGLPPKLQAYLSQNCRLGVLSVDKAIASNDGFTDKFLLRLGDGECIETVSMQFTGRMTACVSSQVGCAMGCVFCATGQGGYKRHLSSGEIVAQVVHVQRYLKSNGQRLRNIVLMGMGEPLHNYDQVMKAIDVMCDGAGLALGAKKITLSTVGLAPAIRRMADEGRKVYLAVSLHAATQMEREALVPAARKWKLEELMDACRYYSGKLGRRIFFEWTLIEGHNDSEAHALAVAQLLSGLSSQVNLIPLNPTAGYAGGPARSEAAKRFQTVLAAHGIPSTVRQRRGIDIAAGCGQLAAK